MAKNKKVNNTNKTSGYQTRGRTTTNKLYSDIMSEEVTLDMVVRAIAKPKNIFFTKKTDEFGHQIVRMKLDNMITKEYDADAVMELIEDVVCQRLFEKFGNYVMAYVSELNPQFELPSNAPKEAISRVKKVMDETNDNYIISEKIKDAFLHEYDVDPSDLDNNEQWLEIVNDSKKTIYETNIIHSFMELYMVLNAYETAFEKSTLKEKVIDYTTKRKNMTIEAIYRSKDADEDILLMVFSSLFRKKSSIMSLLNEKYGIKPLSDAEVIKCIEQYLSDEYFEEFVTEYGDCIIDREEVIDYLTNPKKAGLMTYEEFQEKVNRSGLDSQYLATHNRELIQYMTKEQVVKLYADGHLEDRDLRKYIRPEDILDLPVDKHIKLVALMRSGNGRVFLGKYSEKIWQMFEEGEFTAEDVKRLEKAEYFSIEAIVKQYIENSRRQIANELGDLPKISEENLFKYFTPDIIMRELGKKNSDTLVFYKEMLKSLYEKYDVNLEEVISAELLKEENKSKAIEQASELYLDGIIGIDKLKEAGIGEDEAIRIMLENKSNESVLIDIFNNRLVSELRMFEEVLEMDTDLAYDLIKKGMSARVIKGLETTKALIEMTRSKVDENGNEIPPVLTYENLVEIKDDIVTGLDEKGNTKSGNGTSTLLELYMNDDLTFSELYGLMEAGVITIDEANEIDEKYGYAKDWEKLKEQGVKGRSLKGLVPNPDPDSKPSLSKDSIGIDEECIIDLYISLGADEYLEIDSKSCPVFKDYIIIPIMDKKVAYLEGKDGRTYIVPLKIVLEQINHPKGELDLIGNATSRTVFNSQKQHIRSANHTRNWGRKVVQKTAELPSVPMSMEEAKKFIEENMDTIMSIGNSYDTRKYAKDNIGNSEPVN